MFKAGILAGKCSKLKPVQNCSLYFEHSHGFTLNVFSRGFTCNAISRVMLFHVVSRLVLFHVFSL